METKFVTISELFSGKNQYTVPLFQRNYVWKLSNQQTLWDDIVNFYHEYYSNKSSEKMPFFYCGTCYLQKEDANSNQWIIVDGQQRLISISCMLLALRSIFPEYSDKINALLSSSSDLDSEIHNRSRINPSDIEHDNNVFYGILFEDNKIHEHRIYQAFSTYSFYFRELNSKSYNGPNVSEFLDIITNSIRFALISLDYTEDPNTIFEAVNGKGMQLTEADLSRNQFFRNFKNKKDAENIFKNYWEKIEERLTNKGTENGSEISFTQFLINYYNRNGGSVRKSTVFSTIKKDLENLPIDRIIEKIKDLSVHSEIYAFLKDPLHETYIQDEDIQHTLYRILLLEPEHPLPFLMSAIFQYMNSTEKTIKLEREELLKVLNLIEGYLLKRSICGYSSNVLPQAFQKICSENVEEEPILYIKVKKSINSLRELFSLPSVDEFKEELKFIRYKIIESNNEGALFDPNKDIMVLLFAIEEGLRKTHTILHGKGDWANLYENIKVQHIIPLNISDEWKKELGVKWPQIIKKMGNDLGNLSLSPNSNFFINNSFKNWKNHNIGYNIMLNESIIHADKWDIQYLKKRKEFLIAQAIETFSE